MTKIEKSKKSKGPIRTEAIIPVTILLVLGYLYFAFLFDLNLKSAFEWAGYKALGSEVNIAKVETSFYHASISIQGIEITDSEVPTRDSISIGEVRFSMLWDALLRAKILINEMAVQGVSFHTPRKYPGKVAPPPAPTKEEPSLVATEAGKLKDAALDKTKEEYNENILGDVASMLSGSSSDAQLEKLKESLPSKKMAEELQKNLQDRSKIWDEKIKTLPQGKEIQSLGDRLGKVKTKDFKSVDELQKSLQELDAIFKEADSKYKTIDAVQKIVSEDLKKTQDEFKALEAQVKVDTKTLEDHFHIPKIDAKSLTMALFKKYMGPYEAKFNRYKALADKYLPPKLLKKKTAEEKAEEAKSKLEAHVREKGVTYEFGRQNAYPAFWIKRIGISSQAGVSPYSGNISGEILDITSNQRVTGKPTTAKISGDFPSAQLSGLKLNALLDNRGESSKVDLSMNVGSYVIDQMKLVESSDANIGFKKAEAKLAVDLELLGLKDLKLNMRNDFSKIDYSISASNSNVDEILKKVFSGIALVNVNVAGAGTFPKVNFDISSNLGAELQKGFETQIQAKINDAKAKVQAMIDEQVGKQKAQIEQQINSAKAQVEGEVKKVQDQLNTQKKQAEGKVDSAKKDAENQAKKKLEGDGQKALDDLKKKFGL